MYSTYRLRCIVQQRCVLKVSTRHRVASPPCTQTQLPFHERSPGDPRSCQNPSQIAGRLPCDEAPPHCVCGRSRRYPCTPLPGTAAQRTVLLPWHPRRRHRGNRRARHHYHAVPLSLVPWRRSGSRQAPAGCTCCLLPCAARAAAAPSRQRQRPASARWSKVGPAGRLFDNQPIIRRLSSRITSRAPCAARADDTQQARIPQHAADE